MSSYDKNARRPTVGSMWVWMPGRTELIEVTEVIWNGEEWFVRTHKYREAALVSLRGPGVMNDLDRFWEACHAVAAKPGPKGGRSVVGPPTEAECKWALEHA